MYILTISIRIVKFDKFSSCNEYLIKNKCVKNTFILIF